MPGFTEELAPVQAEAQAEWTVLKQRVDLDVDFPNKRLKGSTELTVQPLVKDLRQVRLHCRQCKPTLVQAGGITARWEYEDVYRRSRMPANSTVEQHGMLKSKIELALGPEPQPELTITLPAKLKIQELSLDPATALPQYDSTPGLQKQEQDAMAVVDAQPSQSAQGPQFAPIKLYMEFEVDNFRDGLHWVGLSDDTARYPCVYTKADRFPGNSSCIFPCVDDATTRCTWELAIKCPRTLGDAFRKPKSNEGANAKGPGDVDMADGIEAAPVIKPSPATIHTNYMDILNGVTQAALSPAHKRDEYLIDLNAEEAAMDLVVVSVGDLVDDVADTEDDTCHTVTYNLGSAVAARHLGFAIGPFEHVDLSAFRPAEEEEKLGRSAIKVDGYCMPRKSEELGNTAYPVYLALDFFGVNFGSFPFSEYRMLFVDDLPRDTVPMAGLTFCSSDLLFPPSVIEPITRNTKTIMRAVADQWMGVNVIAKEAADEWIVAGIAGFMTDLMNKKLFGNNDYRMSQKQAADQIYEQDVERPSLQQLGALLHLDPTIREFVDTKSALLLAVLDRRLLKASSSTGVTRIINKVFLNAKTGTLVNGELSTTDFQRTCEKLGHNKLEQFFRQYVQAAGCPIFQVTQRFNKKKLVVEMTITQRQRERLTKPEFAPSNFWREIKEFVGEVWAPEVPTVFTGPMTVRIHEADGTPYEHIIDIKEMVTKLDIPYNTKYKRLKRSKRQKERAMATAGGEGGGEEGGESLLYCLGDIFDSPQEVEEWKLKDWTPEEENMMGQESYEWIRMDADFEWIGKIHLQLPLYMYVSQLQQDRDLVAQYESVKYIQSCGAHQTSLSVLVRTMMDHRYFHGIRTMAADAIALVAKDGNAELKEIAQYQLDKAFTKLFCYENSVMPRPNDWTSRVDFIMQCAIPQALAKLRETSGKVPLAVRKFFVDKLKFNENANDEMSDAHYIATLMKCLTDTLVVSHPEPPKNESYSFEFEGFNEPMEEDVDTTDSDFEKEAIVLLERFRRTDETQASYQNILSVTAIECIEMLVKGSIIPPSPMNWKQMMGLYIRRGVADNVRLAAYKCYVETGFMRNPDTLSYMIEELSEDPSPLFRQRLMALVGVALGHIALGDDENVKQEDNPDTGLIIEGEVSNEERHLQATRKTSPEGALAAMKKELQGSTSFRSALWYAATSPMITLNEIAEFTDIAALIFEAKTSFQITLKLPKMWRATNKGGGKVGFTQQRPFRTKPVKPLPLEDWESLQAFGLAYTGPVSQDVQKAQSQQDTADAIRLQIEQLRQQQSIKATEMHQQQPPAPSAMPPPPTLPTPAVERSGFRLSLGSGNKRKQGTSATPREGSPKATKVSRQSTPNGAASGRESPDIPLKMARRGSTPGSGMAAPKKPKSKIVTIKLGEMCAARAASILSKPPAPRRGSVANARRPSHDAPFPSSRSITPSMSQHQQPSYLSQPILQSPTRTAPTLLSPGGYSASPSTSLNVGGFRSYGPPEPEVKQEPVAGNVGGFRAMGDVPSASPSTAGSPVDGEPPKPKKKFTLKLGKKSEG